MEKKTSMIPVSSTPHPKRKGKVAFDLFGNDTLLSPIRVEAEAEGLRPNIVKDTAVTIKPETKRRKHAAKDGVCSTSNKAVSNEKAESASSAVLKELNVKKDVLSRTMLSNSRITYNMYPEPIILDSDEDDDFSLSVNCSKATPAKRRKQMKQESAAPRTYNKKTEKRKQPTETRRSKRVTGEEEEPPQITSTKTVPSKTNMKRVEPSTLLRKANKINIDKVETITSQRKTNNVVDEAPAKNTNADSSSVVIVGERKNIFSFHEDDLSSSEKDDVDFPPRILKRKQECLLSESLRSHWDKEEAYNRLVSKDKNVLAAPDVNNMEPSGKFTTGIGAVVEKKSKKFPEIPASRKHAEKLPVCEKLQSNTKKTDENENINPFGFFSQFSKVVFKHNRHCGGIVAKCLDTGRNDFGFVEVDKKEEFIGTRSKTTFVILEGKVKATQLNNSRILVPGDILHINNDAEYRFANPEGTPARLLYVREKSL